MFRFRKEKPKPISIDIKHPCLACDYAQRITDQEGISAFLSFQIVYDDDNTCQPFNCMLHGNNSHYLTLEDLRYDRPLDCPLRHKVVNKRV